MRRFLLWLQRVLPAPRVIYDRAGVRPYLSRWYLIGMQRTGDPLIKGNLSDDAPRWLQRLPINLFLHRFHRGDDDMELHSHPWSWAVSLVLSGGYTEERRIPTRFPYGRGTPHRVITRTVRPWSLNFLKHDTYHRVDLRADDCWSLFLVGPKRGTWYFWNRDTHERVDWREHIMRVRG